MTLTQDFGLLFALMALWGLNFKCDLTGREHVHPLVLHCINRLAQRCFPFDLFIKKPDVKSGAI